MGKEALFGMLLVLLLIIIGCVDAEGIGISEIGVKYDNSILENFIFYELVPVVIKIKDVSGINLSRNDSMEERTEKLREREMILNNITNSVLSAFSKDEFKLEGRSVSGRSFHGNISKQGFGKLLKDSRVKKIYDNTKKGHVDAGMIIQKSFIYIIPILLGIALIILLIKLKKKRKWKTEKKS